MVEGGVSAGLLERREELARVDGVVESAVEGGGCVLLLAGEAGIGKTSLVRAARERAAGVMTVLSARGAQLEREFSFGVVRQLLEPLLATMPEDERRRLYAGPGAAAERLVTEGPSRTGTLPSEALLATIHALYWVIARVAAERPLLLAVDDAHWADRESLRFVNYLAGRLEALPVLVVVAIRVAEPGAEQELLDALAAEPAAQRVRLTGLSVEAVGQLLERHHGRAVDVAFAAACHEATRGNPFLAGELMAALDADAVDPVAANAGLVDRLGPAAVAGAVLARVARLAPECAALAGAVAVLGPDADVAVAAELADVGRPRAMEAADELSRAQVLAARQPLDFVHPIVRAAIYEDIAPGERAAAHARAAQILHAADASTERVAAHLMASPPGQGEWAVGALVDAARQAMARGAPATAAPLLRRALAEDLDAALRADVLELLGLAATASGDRAGSRHLQHAVELLDDPRRRLNALTALGSVHFARGELEPAAAAYDQARELAEELFPRTAWVLEIPAVVLRIYDLDARARTLPRLAELLERPGLEAMPAGRLLLMHDGFEKCYGRGPREASLAVVERVLSQRRTADTADFHAFCNAGLLLGLCDEFERANAVLTDTLRAASEQGFVVEAAHAHMARSFVALRSGDIDAAHDDARRGVEGVGYGWGNMTPNCYGYLAWSLIEQGDLAAAADALELPGGDEPWHGHFSYPFLLEARGHHRLVCGDFAGARRLFRDAGDRLTAGHIRRDTYAPTPWRVGAALAAAGLGEHEEARALVAEELAQAREFGAPRSIGMALRVAGLVEGTDRGIELSREAIAVLAPSGARLEHARALVDLGAALRRRGDRRDARQPLADGLTLARRCGATALAQRAHEELTATGARPRKILRSGVAALTASERRVARLAADGMSNKDIAGALFLTVNTVQTHLHRAYQKLAITSRNELPSALGWTAATSEPEL